MARGLGSLLVWEERTMKTKLMMTAAAGAIATAGLSSIATAEDLTLCWAAWDPANALI